MSNLLDHKEEVLKVEMTKHGRKMFGLGFFKPSYFSFFDDSIIYDSSYCGDTSENTNNIHDRILYNSLTFSSLDLLSKDNQNILGQSDPFSDYAPSWSIKALNGKLTYKNVESSYYKKKFTFGDINCNLSFKDKATPSEDIIIDSDYILLDIQESNVGDDISNFEIELLYYDPLMSGSVSAIEQKLLFIDKKTNIIDDIIYDEEELPSNYFDIEFNKEHASYYFDVLVDQEIDTDYITSAGTGIYERIKGFASQIPSLLNKRITDGISAQGGPGDRIVFGPNGEIISAEPMQVEYMGSVCTASCCP